MHTANAIAEVNPRGLVDLVRAIVRPHQADYLLAVAECGTDARPDLEEKLIFGEEVRRRMFSDRGDYRLVRLPEAHFQIHLARDPVLPWPWKHHSYVCTLARIGTAKVDMEDIDRRHHCGPWRQDVNHRVELWLPWGIGFVIGGNHSIAAGILAGEGVLTPAYVYDMSYLFSEIYADAESYREIGTGNRLGPVINQRFAALFEVGRLMHVAGFPAFRESIDAAWTERASNVPKHGASNS
ncbi:DUF6710 family protein [Paraburkholderia caledonica]|nr:DUF6710 family protein [Paraburkholderia caledonica]